MGRAERLSAVTEALRASAPEPKTVASLAEQFGVTVRTIERDLTALRESGVPILAPNGASNGYTLDLNNTLPGVYLSATEANAVVVALARNASGRLATANVTARRKVLGAMSTIDASAARRLSNTIHDIQATTAEVPPSSVINEAIGQHGVVEIRYRASDATISTRQIEPIGIVSRDGSWLVLAWCRLGDVHRTFRLDRIDEAVQTSEVAPERESPDMAGLLSQPDLFS